MRKLYLWVILTLLLLATLTLSSSGQPSLQSAPTILADCKDFAFSTEEDFLSHGPKPADGNPLISDGDLLSRTGTVCLRNRELLQNWEIAADLGLDGVDLLSVEQNLVSFSTELDDPRGRFTAGDLLSTWGGVIPNQALLIRFQVFGNRGLDSIQWIGEINNIIAFHDFARSISRDEWLRNPGRFIDELQRFKVDVWFSIEGTERRAATVPIYDGDILSAAGGSIVYRNSNLLPASVPAGIPDRGIDFGVDAFAAPRVNERGEAYFSTEILYNGQPQFNDGDMLKLMGGVVLDDQDLTAAFEPDAHSLGLDALHINFGQPTSQGFLPRILYLFRGLLQ